MADRKKAGTGKRKAAEGKPKAAPKRQRKGSGTSPQPPHVPPGLLVKAEPVPFEGMAASSGSATGQGTAAATGAAISAAVGSATGGGGAGGVGHQVSADIGPVVELRADATVVHQPAVLAAADPVARLFEQIGGTLSAALNLPATPGGNQASIRTEGIRGFEVHIRLGTLALQLVREEAQSERPSQTAVEETAVAVDAVEVEAKSFLQRLRDGLISGAGSEIGKSLIRQLEAQVTNLLHLLPPLSDALHHWASLLVS